MLLYFFTSYPTGIIVWRGSLNQLLFSSALVLCVTHLACNINDVEKESHENALNCVNSHSAANCIERF
jgi:hypothetical protein